MRGRLIRSTMLVACVALLSACGGGGDAGGEVPTPVAGGTAATASNPAVPAMAPGASATATPGAIDPVTGLPVVSAAAGLPRVSANREDVAALAVTSGASGVSLFDPQASFDTFGGGGGSPSLASPATPMQPPAPMPQPMPPAPPAPQPVPITPVRPALSPEVDRPTVEPVRSTYTQAKISLNGQVYVAKKGTVFPKDEQIFKVLTIGESSVTVELVAGEFKNGSTGVTLDRGKELEIVNQDEGTTWKLKLLSTSR